MTEQSRQTLHAIKHYSRRGFFGLSMLTIFFLSSCASKPVYGPTSEPSPLTYQPETSNSTPVTAADVTTSKSYNKPYKVRGKNYYPITSSSQYTEQGTASWYGQESGNITSTGARFRPQGLTAAHKTLPLPSKVRVTNLSNGRSIVVIVNDRGPFKDDRLIDLSQGAAKKIGLKGLAKVKIETLESPSTSNNSRAS